MREGRVSPTRSRRTGPALEATERAPKRNPAQPLSPLVV